MGAVSKLDPKNVNVPTLTNIGTVLIPFESGAHKAIVELSFHQWIAMRGRVDEQFARADRQVEQAAAMLEIDKFERITGRC